MTEPKFTPGPWEVFKCTASDGEIYVRVQTEYNLVENGENIGPETICAIGGYPTIPLDGGAEWEATGNLIAAAPDMYEALEEVIKIYNFKEMVRTDKTIHSPRDDPDRGKIFFTYNDLSKARNALRKARGETE